MLYSSLSYLTSVIVLCIAVRSVQYGSKILLVSHLALSVYNLMHAGGCKPRDGAGGAGLASASDPNDLNTAPTTQH